MRSDNRLTWAPKQQQQQRDDMKQERAALLCEGDTFRQHGRHSGFNIYRGGPTLMTGSVHLHQHEEKYHKVSSWLIFNRTDRYYTTGSKVNFLLPANSSRRWTFAESLQGFSFNVHWAFNSLVCYRAGNQVKIILSNYSSVCSDIIITAKEVWKIFFN